MTKTQIAATAIDENPNDNKWLFVSLSGFKYRQGAEQI